MKIDFKVFIEQEKETFDLQVELVGSTIPCSAVNAEQMTYDKSSAHATAVSNKNSKMIPQ